MNCIKVLQFRRLVQQQIKFYITGPAILFIHSFLKLLNFFRFPVATHSTAVSVKTGAEIEKK